MDSRTADAKNAKCPNDNCYCIRLSANHIEKNPGSSNESYHANTEVMIGQKKKFACMRI